MKYYKIVYGYSEADYLPITSEELVKATVLFMEGKGRGVFEEGAVRGQDIMRIIPDWHRAMGWNKGYKMTTDDFEEIKHLENPYRETQEKAKLLTEIIVRESKYDLIKLPSSEIAKKLDVQLPHMKQVELLAEKLSI